MIIAKLWFVNDAAYWCDILDVASHSHFRGYYPSTVILYTDDWRLEAIGLYLSLGFEPQMTRDDMPDRWSDIMQKLGK